MTECVICGCDDQASCIGGCHWLSTLPNGLGICSSHAQEFSGQGQEEIDAELAAMALDQDLLEEGPLEALDFNDTPPSSGILLPGDPEYEETLRDRSH